MQIIGSNEPSFGNIPEQILHRSHASCECFTLISHIYVPIRLHHVLQENNEHIITSNGRINGKLLKYNYK